ncbi:MAG: DinB family protein [Candidatus Dormibacterales bacterium]
MKIESTAYTSTDLEKFLDELVDHDRKLVADRLEAASVRLAELGPRIQAGHGDDSWSAHEILAHIAVLSKFYGVLVHKISSGQLPELNLLKNVNLRDVAGQQMAELEPAELLRLIKADHDRTLKTLRSVEPSALRRASRLEDGTTMTAMDVARLPLLSHLELHLKQLEQSLGA